jgi:hypothetical protein
MAFYCSVPEVCPHPEITLSCAAKTMEPRQRQELALQPTPEIPESRVCPFRPFFHLQIEHPPLFGLNSLATCL